MSGFEASSQSNVAVYWGQASAGSQESLATYCKSDDVDIVLISFLHTFPQSIGLDFSSACSSTFSNGLLHCSEIAQDIKTCQSLGKKVLLSLGGAIGSYGFTSDSQAEDFADTLWNTFAGGSADERPFDDAVVDGFDFDIEDSQPEGYAALAKRLRKNFDSASKEYYLSAAPQCYYPDASVGDLLNNADIDFAFVQFYNNFCNVDKQFNWDTWLNYAETVSPNSNIKIYLGLPGAASAAGSGYISDLSLIKSTVQTMASSQNFGGIMLWDASQGFTNTVDDATYVAQMKKILKENTGSSSAPTTAVPSSTSTAVSSSTSVSIQSSSTSSFIVTSAVTSSETSQSSSTSSIPTSSLVAASHVHASQRPTTAPIIVASTIVKSSATTLTTEITTCTNSAVATFTNSNRTITFTFTSEQGDLSTSLPSETAVTSTLSTPSSHVPTPSTTTSTLFVSSTALQSSSASPTSDSSTVSTLYVSSASGPSSTRVTLAPTTVPSYAPTSTSSTSNSAPTSWAQKRVRDLNTQFAAGQLNGQSSCSDGEISCSADGEIAICDHGAWVFTKCADGTTCFAYDNNDIVYVSCNFSYMRSSFA